MQYNWNWYYLTTMLILISSLGGNTKLISLSVVSLISSNLKSSNISFEGLIKNIYT